MTLHRHSGKAGYFMDVRDWLCFRARDKEVGFFWSFVLAEAYLQRILIQILI